MCTQKAHLNVRIQPAKFSFPIKMTNNQLSTHQEIVANVSSAVPRFTAVGLAPGRTYAAAVLAYNAKGRGDPYPLRASTLRPPEKHHVHDKSLGELLMNDFVLVFPSTVRKQCTV